MSDVHACANISWRERKKQATRSALHESAFRMVKERGLQGVTVEEICDEVGISVRTFFNYYPTKVAAAFDLLVADVAPETADWYLHARGSLLGDTCELVARSVTLPSDYRKVKALLHEDPDLAVVFWRHMFTHLHSFRDLIDARTGDHHLTGVTFGLVMLGLVGMMRESGETTPEGISRRLRAEIGLMRGLVDEISEDLPAPTEN